MPTHKLLAPLENLNHPQRWQHMINLGVKAQTAPTLKQQLYALSDSSVHYERLLSLMSIHGSHDKPLTLKLLGDSSSFYGWAIAKLAACYLDDQVLINIYPSLPQERTLHLLKALSRANRTSLIDTLFHSANTPIKKSLPQASEQIVIDYLSRQGITELKADDVAKLARTYPKPLHEVLQNELLQHNQVSWRLKQACEAAIDKMAIYSPSLGLTLLQQLAKLTGVNTQLYSKYIVLFPEETIELLLTQPNPISLSFSSKLLRRLPCETLIYLINNNTIANLQQHFTHLHIEQRIAIYHSCADLLRDKLGKLPFSYLQGLPKAIREQEALYTFELPLLATKPLIKIPYLAVLPFSQALSKLDAFFAQPDGELRASALASLVTTGRYYPEHLPEILAFCLKRENEQDPVRLAMIEALASLPPTRWQAEHLSSLAQIIKHVLSARDCSHKTLSFASHLLLNMMAQQTTFVINQLPTLLERMGSMGYYNIESRITTQQMQQLVPHLLPLLNTWLTRDRAHFVTSLILSFGIRAKGIKAFADLLIKLTADKRGNIARLGIENLINLEFYQDVNQLIPKLLKEDPSWIRVECVANYLHHHHQQLLTPFLTLQPYKGRFSTKTNTVPYFYDGFNRWTVLQQNTYANSLMVILETPKRNMWELYRTAEQLSAMPSIPIEPLTKLARLDNPDPALRDKVIGLLGRLDAGRGIPPLLNALDDNRARVAIYALRRNLLRMPKENALALLATVPITRVTVAKETLHLIGEFVCEQSYHILNQHYTSEKLHPDVKIALLRAYWNYLNHKEVWQKMHQATQESAAIARSTIRIPQEELSIQANLLLLKHIHCLLLYPDPLVHQETLERLVSMPVNDTQETLRSSLIKLLNGIDKKTVQLAAQALLSCCAYQEDQALVDTFAQTTNARYLEAIVNAYRIQHSHIRHAFITWSAQQLANQLVEKVWQITQAVRLIITIDSPKNNVAFFKKLTSKALLHPGIIDTCRSSYKLMAYNNQHGLEAIELTLRQDQNYLLWRIGLDLLLILTNHFGWQEHYRAALITYTNDEHPWCSETAQLIEPRPDQRSMMFNCTF